MAEETPERNPAPGGPLADILAAAAFLTRLPLPIDHARAGAALGRAAWAWPLVGAGVGAVGGGVILLTAGTGLHPLACGLLALAAMAILTGALHEDGLADLADGLGVMDRDRRLEVMKDSRLGTFGALALIFSVGLRVTALASLNGPGIACGALVAAGALSRAVMAPTLRGLRPAKENGLGAGAGRPPVASAAAALGIGLAIAVAALWPATGPGAVAAVAAAGAAALFMTWALNALLGGHTGDGLGAQQQVTETALYLAAAVAEAAR